MHTWGRKIPPPPGIELGPPGQQTSALPTELLRHPIDFLWNTVLTYIQLFEDIFNYLNASSNDLMISLNDLNISLNEFKISSNRTN